MVHLSREENAAYNPGVLRYIVVFTRSVANSPNQHQRAPVQYAHDIKNVKPHLMFEQVLVHRQKLTRSHKSPRCTPAPRLLETRGGQQRLGTRLAKRVQGQGRPMRVQRVLRRLISLRWVLV